MGGCAGWAGAGGATTGGRAGDVLGFSGDMSNGADCANTSVEMEARKAVRSSGFLMGVPFRQPVSFGAEV